MRIAFIATEKLPVPAVRGGAIQIYIDGVTKIISKNHDVTVFSITDEQLPNKETKNRVSYIRYPEDQYLQGIQKGLKERNFDVVHLCNRPKWINEMKEVAPNTKFVLSVHNEMFTEEKISEEEGSICIDSVEKIVTVSDYIGSTISLRFPKAKGKISTVYSGVDLANYYSIWSPTGNKRRQEVRKELGIVGRDVVLFVGRLSKVKGPHLLLQALPSIIEKHPKVMLVFIGSKWFGENQINNYVKHLYTLGALHQENVTFIKFVEPSRIPILYNMADIFVCSSQWQEPLARVHYEAMASGLPIITSNRGGNPEVIDQGKNGYIIDDFENPEEYAKHINSLLEKPATRERIGKNGRLFAEKQFGWSRVASDLLNVYQTI
ncbi:glycosyltransferase family 4 protein [Bacillus carboniphilus]|uniref:Glycosyltransferase family 4 protein n=1 Tax=Bacillus carboniphilus TaxID=86663 RepID=A0ABY9JXE3_9BACI|nr:glycosyltransferase family 4 protein [Bacillus carboniphilus]WLR42993.1 glycosyltransferase family 4 protein [Bacillus carboniphilus]